MRRQHAEMKKCSRKNINWNSGIVSQQEPQASMEVRRKTGPSGKKMKVQSFGSHAPAVVKQCQVDHRPGIQDRLVSAHCLEYRHDRPM